MTLSPVLHTARLALRRPVGADVDAFAAFWTSARTACMGGPWTAEEAVAEWPELDRQWERHGFSMFVITRQEMDAPIGLAGPYYPDTHPEPELGWNLWDAAHEGKGLAREAVAAARDWFFAATPHRTAVSYVNPANDRSNHLAATLGAVLDADAACPYPPPVNVWRHKVVGRA